MSIPSSFNRMHVPRNTAPFRADYTAMHPADMERADRKALGKHCHQDKAEIFKSVLFQFKEIRVLEADGTEVPVTPKWVCCLFRECRASSGTYAKWTRIMLSKLKKQRAFCFHRSYISAMQSWGN